MVFRHRSGRAQQERVRGDRGRGVQAERAGAGGARVNKQRAIWCNQYVIKQAASVWVGSIRPGGSLETLLHAIKGKEQS